MKVYQDRYNTNTLIFQVHYEFVSGSLDLNIPLERKTTTDVLILRHFRAFHNIYNKCAKIIIAKLMV